MTEERLPMPEEDSFFDSMKRDVGFDITPANVDLEDSRRFTKLEISPAQQMHISALVQNAPAAIAEGATAQAYFAKFPEGLPHTLVNLKQGGVGSMIRGENGRFAGHASFYQFQTQALILGAFTAMSIASGQYFLAQINSQLDMMQKKLDDVLQFLYGDKKAELISEMKFAQYAYANFNPIMDNEVQRIATITNLQEGKKIAMKDIEFYIEDLYAKANKEVKDGKGWIAATEEAFKTKECLELSIQLYVMTTVLEVYYSQNQDQTYLDYLEKDMTTYVSKCDKRILSSFSTLKGRVAGHKAKPLDKTDLADLIKEIDKLLDKLNQGEETELQKSLHDALNVAEQSTEYYLSANGDVYVKAS